ncbi:hypothetical protein AB205_0050220 [Aquarana catesbeiana]|uniref:Uncharacterized protein n=1 Tax=Aquarana catesbeiana TaxID=8400 RepID=A0A2G9R8Z3_AQUCT|nr:hypothetical protein AB205_0050220 [Aquarana catesbeiana]
MVKVVKSLHHNFGVRRSKDQLRKRWSDLKLREHDQYRRIRRVLQKSKKLCCVPILYFHYVRAAPCAFFNCCTVSNGNFHVHGHIRSYETLFVRPRKHHVLSRCSSIHFFRHTSVK